MISLHLVGTESDLHCCNGSEGLHVAEISQTALRGFLENMNYFKTKVSFLPTEQYSTAGVHL